jgi:hypothetical protein
MWRKLRRIFSFQIILARLGLGRLEGLRIQFAGWLSVAVVVCVALVLISNLIRVAANAQNSVEVYSYEQRILAELQDHRDELARQLQFYTSTEYQLVYARNARRLAAPGETLVDIVENQRAVPLAKQAQDLTRRQDYSVFWATLLP